METPYIENSRLRIGLLVFFAYLIWQLDYSKIETNRTLCVFHAITGKNCYGCGLLKGVAACMHLDFLKAWQLNHLNVITIPLVSYIALKEILLKEGILPIIKNYK